MSATLDKEFEAHMSEEAVSEEAATGVAAIKKGAKPAEKMDSSGANHTSIGGSDSDSMEGAKGTKNLGSAAAAPVKHEGSKTLSTKPSAASAKMEETESDEEETTLTEAEYDFTEDVDALVAGEELSEEFKTRARTIFEAAVTSRVNEEVAVIQEALEESFAGEVEKLKTELSEKVDDYLSYAVSSWMEENALQIEHGIKNDMAESFFNGLKSLFIEHNFGVPEEKFNLLDGMAEQIDEMEQKLNEQIEANVSLHKEIGVYVRDGIVNECSSGLTETQKEKLFRLAEGVEFESEEDFRQKIETIKESYFNRKMQESAQVDPTEDVQPLVEEATNYSASMRKYVDAIARWSGN